MPPTLTAEQRASFEREVTALLPELYAAARRLARNQADAEDLVAEAILKAWEGLASLRDAGALRGWILRILSNTFVSHCRARAARPRTEPLGEDGDEEGEAFSLFERLHQPFLLWWGNPEQDFLNRLLREDLERAVDSLPEEYRVTVVLADIQGFSYQEIADTLAVPIGTVRSRLARARARLQQALWSHAQEAGLTPSPITKATRP